jgi:hypothetical protein
LAALALGGCGGQPEGRTDIAAEAGGATLDPARLAQWVAKVPSRQPSVRDAEFVSAVWVDYTLLTQALERGDSLTDSPTVEAALGPDLAMQTLRAWHDTLVARRPRIAADRPDSMYAHDTVRVFQHILLPVADPQDVRQVTGVRATADSLLATAREGAEFATLAIQRSKDSSTAAGGGFLPVGGRGLMPPEFERAAWRLGAGEVGGVASRAGFHIVRRPPLEEVRDRLAQYAESLAMRRADSLHLDSLTTAAGLAVTKEAVGALRGFFSDPATRGEVAAPVATWTGGQLALPEVANWIDLLPPRGYLDLRGASDLTLERFVRELGQQQLLLNEARAAGIGIALVDRAGLDSLYRRNLAASLALLGLTDSVRTLPVGAGVARVEALLDGLTSDQERWRPLPGALAAVLRERGGYRLHQAGMVAAAESARASATAGATKR